MFIAHAQHGQPQCWLMFKEIQILKSFKGSILKGLKILVVKALVFPRTVNYPLDPASLFVISVENEVYLPI